MAVTHYLIHYNKHPEDYEVVEQGNMTDCIKKQVQCQTLCWEKYPGKFKVIPIGKIRTGAITKFEFELNYN